MAASAEAPAAPMLLSATLQSEGQDEHGERVGVSMGADKATGRGAPQLGDLRLLQDGDEREGTLAVDIVLVETANERGGAGMVSERKRVNGR